MATWSIVVTGHVQGVGYRAYARFVAVDLEVRGEVWNRGDRAVELVAQHDDEAILEELCRRLHDGPGRVVAVARKEVFTNYRFEGFNISFTR